MTSIFTKEQFLRFQAAFKTRAKSGLNDSADMMLYNIIRGKNVDHGFSPVTNKVKLHNGAAPWYGLTHAKNCVYIRVHKTKWEAGSVKKIWDPAYLNSAFGIDATEDQLKWIATFAGWKV